MLSKGGEDVTDRLLLFPLSSVVSFPFCVVRFCIRFYAVLRRFVARLLSLSLSLSFSRCPSALGAELIRSLDVCFAPGHPQHPHKHATRPSHTVYAMHYVHSLTTVVLSFTRRVLRPSVRTLGRVDPFASAYTGSPSFRTVPVPHLEH